MKTRILLVTAAVMLLGAVRLYAVPEDKTFNSSGQILPGEEWNNVYIYNDDTIVDMLGGDVDSIATYDASIINVTAGSVNTLTAVEFSTANVSGGYVYGLDAWNRSTINFYDAATGLSLGARDFGTVNMTSGTTEYLRTGNSGTINLYGGTVSEYLNAWDSATVNIFGYNFNYDPVAGSWDGGQLTGFWNDDTVFTIDLYNTETYNHINLIPEPASFMLLAFGTLLLKRKKILLH